MSATPHALTDFVAALVCAAESGALTSLSLSLELSGRPLRLSYGELRQTALALPQPPRPAPAAGGDADKGGRRHRVSEDCGREVAALLRKVGRRLTLDALVEALQADPSSYSWSRSSVSSAAGHLKAVGELDSRRDAYGHGYGLAEWSATSAAGENEGGPDPAPVPIRNCAAEVLALLSSSAERMTAGEIAAALTRWTLAEVKEALGELAAEGKVTDDKDERGDGFGLAAWREADAA